jgi:hypothetical protein
MSGGPQLRAPEPLAPEHDIAQFRRDAYPDLATGSVMHAAMTGKLRRNMPEPVPVLVIGRLAIDDAFKGQRYGEAILKDAMIRCFQASKTVGVRAIMVHAKDEKSAALYLKYKFIQSRTNPLTFLLPIETVEQVFE